VAAHPFVVEGPRHQLLPGAALPLDEDGGVGGGHALHQGQDLLHAAALAEDALHAVALRQRRLEVPHGRPQAGLLGDAADAEEQLLQVQRLAEEVRRPLLHGLHRDLHAAVGRHEEQRHLRVDAPEGAQEVQAGHPGHPAVAKHEIHPALAQARHRLGAARRLEHLVPLLHQEAGDQLALRRFIIHQQDAERLPHALPQAPAGSAGSVKTKRAPARLASARSSPPCSRRILRARASPSPVPSSLVVK